MTFSYYYADGKLAYISRFGDTFALTMENPFVKKILWRVHFLHPVRRVLFFEAQDTYFIFLGKGIPKRGSSLKYTEIEFVKATSDGKFAYDSTIFRVGGKFPSIENMYIIKQSGQYFLIVYYDMCPWVFEIYPGFIRALGKYKSQGHNGFPVSLMHGKLYNLKIFSYKERYRNDVFLDVINLHTGKIKRKTILEDSTVYAMYPCASRISGPIYWLESEQFTIPSSIGCFWGNKHKKLVYFPDKSIPYISVWRDNPYVFSFETGPLGDVLTNAVFVGLIKSNGDVLIKRIIEKPPARESTFYKPVFVNYKGNLYLLFGAHRRAWGQDSVYLFNLTLQ